MSKQTAGWIYNGILLSNKKHCTFETWNKVNNYENNYENNVDKKWHTVWFLLYKTLANKSESVMTEKDQE